MVKVTDADLVADAQSYPSRTAWKKGSPQYYSLVCRQRHHLKARCVELMGPPQGPRYAGYEVYIYRFSDGCLYIGITSVPARRHCFHRTVGLVAKKGLPWKLKTVGRGLRMVDATETEKRWIALAKAKGRRLLNRSDGGELGGISRKHKYTYDDVLKAAQLCESLSEFRQRHPAVYQFMYARSMAAQVRAARGWVVSRPVRKWTFVRCFAEARTYQFSSDWKRASKVSYSIAQQRGWLPAITAELFPMTKKQRDSDLLREFEIRHNGKPYRVFATRPSKARSAVAKMLKQENQPVSYTSMTTTVIKKCSCQVPR